MISSRVRFTEHELEENMLITKSQLVNQENCDPIYYTLGLVSVCSISSGDANGKNSKPDSIVEILDLEPILEHGIEY